MGLSMYGGKSISYTSKNDTIKLNTKVCYRDQHGNEADVNMKKLIEFCKKCKNKRDFFDSFISDVEGDGLHIGFPVIIALNNVAEEFGNEAMQCLNLDKDVSEVEK